MKIKFCGLRRPEDIEYANQTRPDYVGFVFAKSKRQVSPELAGQLAAGLAAGIKKVGVFVNAPLEEILEAVRQAGLDVVQLHGDEGPEEIRAVREALEAGGLEAGTIGKKPEVWKAVRTTDPLVLLAADGLEVDLLLLDAFTPGMAGGTGVVADWDMIRSVKAQLTKPFFLAGGLNAGNIEEAVRAVEPFGIDLSSGIETEGFKDLGKMEDIVALMADLARAAHQAALARVDNSGEDRGKQA
ncbi:phosphoribosylanthranilate isomerase [Acidaminobacter hydrogenoformans]|uniref:N-(5'-phosphoribosyl)anthranilate isomerase n=1 Tax=Acidaminobacter hydrogenoformans DSM 2784 TaxID=1120920 RepID=A0A1G5RRD5_9FIRM|nr:phosphoribosylanthranilate isomerase [Acidaminobacter hydrogenoformans]SCZ76567.1 phosphoribosylanthranilate isomerase [Acidaminobacter hydrogenoformans DSM 2784]